MAKFLDKTGLDTFWAKIKSTFQTLGNLVTSWSSTTSNTKYPSEKLVKDSLDGKLSYLDATYMRNNVAGDGWVKLADIGSIVRSSGDINGVWDVVLVTPAVGIWRESITLDVRFNASGAPQIVLFNRVYENVKKTGFEFCVKVIGLAGSGDSNVELWAKLQKGWYSLGIREAGAGNIATKIKWNYYSYASDGGSSKPVADAGNNIQVADPAYIGGDNFVKVEGGTMTGPLNGYLMSTRATMVGNEYNCLLNAKERGILTFTQSGSGQLTEDQVWKLFDGKIVPQYGTAIDPEDPYILTLDLSSFINSHCQVFSAFGWTCRYWEPLKFKVELYDTYSNVNEWVTICDYSQTQYSGQYSGGGTASLFVKFGSGTVNPHTGVARGGMFKKIRITIWKGNEGTNRWGISEIFFCYPENYSVYGGLHAYAADKATNAEYADKLSTARYLAVALGNTSTDTAFDGHVSVTNIKTTGTLGVGNGGTGKTTAKAAEYNLTTGKSEISDTTSGDDRVVFELASPSESNGVTRGFRKLSTIWTWIKGLLSSESGVNISGNAATASAAQSGSALETAINGKMNTSGSNATAPTSSSSGDGATATLLNNLSDGSGEIVTTDDGDNVLIATTDNGGTVTNKWYKRKLVKLIPWIIKKLGTRLVYDCGAGSTSGDDFDAALAAFNAGQWVIIHDSTNVYYCAGTYNSGLRFKRLTNSASGISVNTLNWTRGSSPSAGSQLDASLSGHTHTRSDITNFAHTHGNIQDGGALQTSDVTIASGDKLVVTDSSDSGKVARASASFDGSTTTKALTQKGTFETFMTPSAGNAASGALQNLTAQLTEGTSDFTDNTELFSSYAGNNGFAESGHVNQPYRRKASSMLNYVRDSYAIDRSPASVGTAHKRISLGYGRYTSSGVGAATYLVHLFFNYVGDGGGLQGKGITVLVTYDFRFSSLQKSECRILSDNGVRDSGYNVVLANFLSDSGDSRKLHICLGLVKNTAPTTLIEFNYSYCKIFKLCTIGDWTQAISSDAVGTYDYIVQATDLVSSAVNADMVDGKHIVIGSWAGASDTIYFG